MKDFNKAGLTADSLIELEIQGQDKMWGVANERTDSAKGQLLDAGMSQLMALRSRLAGNTNAFDSPPSMYPMGWSGFRDYGSDVANLVVAVAFLRQEIKRKIANGEDTTRKPRDPVKQPYTNDQPNKV